jgi:hypothetical protein
MTGTDIEQSEGSDPMALNVPIIHYRGYRLPDHAQGPGYDVDETSFLRARNDIVEACVRHGTVGPCGKWNEGEDTYVGFELGAPQPKFDIDMEWRNTEHYLYLCSDEKASAISHDWLRDVQATLAERLPLWALCVTDLDEACILIFHNKIMLSGKLFAGVGTIEDLIRSWKDQRRRSSRNG